MISEKKNGKKKNKAGGGKSLFLKTKSFFRKWMSAKIIPHMVLNGWRIFFYRRCGYKIGKNVFILPDILISLSVFPIVRPR